MGLRLSFGSGAGAAWRRLSGDEGLDEGLPGGEDEIAGEGAKVLEEAPALARGHPGKVRLDEIRRST